MDNKDVVKIEDKKGNISWMSQQEYDARKQWLQEQEDFIIRCMWEGKIPEREYREDENVKLAYVNKDGKRKMLGIDNKTMQGYAMSDVPTWKMPLEKEEYDNFERWCTTFDV